VLEAPVPVLGHFGEVVLQDRQHLLDHLLVDDPAQTGDPGVLARDHDRHVVVQDLDGEVVALGPEHLAHLLLHHDAGAVMRIDDLVAALEVDVLDDRDREVLEVLEERRVDVRSSDDVLLGG